MKLKKLATLALIAGGVANAASAAGWPANYEGVMLQGFYWDSYTETSWKALENASDELSQYFSLIWVPNSAKSEGNPSMGYHPVYWFTNHNSSFGTEAELRSMIKTFKQKGTGIIADVVINHRSGVSNWTNFPFETWNGKTYKIGPEGICKDDEVKDASGQAKPTGNYDTGEGWSGSRDLDHTNANVQTNCKDYIKCLMTDYGYSGVRYDFVKGYSPYYTKMYNEANDVSFSVGEYWDGNYDLVKEWIEGTGKTSAAFDFPFKYQLNKAFNGGGSNYGELVWKANGTTDQPAGMIHFGYAQQSVTFVDNHDTYRDGSKYTGDVLMANAFMLSSPGTPCVFYPHYKQYKTQIQAMISARKGAGISNTSAVNVIDTNGCYVAEVTGSKGKLWVKIGNSSKTPGSGYTKKASGNGYEIWTTAQGGGTTPTEPVDPTKEVKIYFKNDKGWTTPYIHYWGSTESAWPGVAMAKEGSVWSYTCPAGTTGCLFNAGDGDATKTGDMIAIDGHLYSTSGDEGVYSAGGGGGGGGNQDVDAPSALYLLGNIPAGHWDTTAAIPMTKSGNVFTCTATIEAPAKSDYGYFSFVTAKGADWDEVNSSDRYGSMTPDELIAVNESADVARFPVGVSASSATSWMILPGTYSFTVDFSTKKLTVTDPTGVSLTGDDEAEAVWFNLQGQRVENPDKGIFIRVVRGKAVKVMK